MKKTSIFLSILAIAGAMTVSCNNQKESEQKAEADATAEEVSLKGEIVFFNIDRVLNEYDFANDLRSEVETKVASIQQEVNRRGSKLEKDSNAFVDKVNKGLLTQSTAQQQQQELQKQQVAFQNYAQQKEAEIMEEQQVMLNRISDAIKQFVDKYQEENLFALILATQGDILPAPVVTGDSRLDVTDQIIEGLNAAYVEQKKSE